VGELFYEHVLIADGAIVDTDPEEDRYSFYAGARIAYLRVIAAPAPPAPSLLALGIATMLIVRARTRVSRRQFIA
jgi:hypothetical protein